MKQQITCMASSYSPSIKFPFLSSHVLNILYSPLNTYKILVAQSLVQPNCVFVARIVILKTDVNCCFFKRCDLFSMPCPWLGDFSSATWLTKSATPNWNCFQKITPQLPHNFLPQFQLLSDLPYVRLARNLRLNYAV